MRRKEMIKALEAIPGNPQVHVMYDDGFTFEAHKVDLVSINEYRDPEDGYTEYHNVIAIGRR